jgi:hydrogenase/urease accessory protein HupE
VQTAPRSLFFLSLLFAHTAAHAHSGRSVSYSDLSVKGNEVTVLLRLAQEDLIEVLSLDLNRDGHIDASEMQEGRTLIGDYLRNNFVIHALREEAGKPRLHPCAPALGGIDPPLPNDDRQRWRVHLRYLCGDCQGEFCAAWRGPEACGAHAGCTFAPADVADLQLRCTIFQGAGFSHQHNATAHIGGTERILFFDARNQEETVVVPLSTQVGRYLLHGILHILSGYDHLLFLFGLLLLGGSFRNLLQIVTSFTVAHSITLILGGLDIVTLPTSIVEPAIALTIAYIGGENLFLRDPKHRWILTFFLGLVHGFGFAGALAETGLPTKGFVLTLFTFNIGVEIGQIGVVAVAWPLLRWMSRQPWHQKGAVRVLSVGILLAGLTLFVLRAFFEVG